MSGQVKMAETQASKRRIVPKMRTLPLQAPVVKFYGGIVKHPSSAKFCHFIKGVTLSLVIHTL
jgi:hypothetical protein